MIENKKHLLSSVTREHIDRWLLRYPPDQKRSGVFESLRVVQEENGGSLTTDLMDAVADYLEIPRVAVYEVVSFYSLYHRQPVGKHVIDICSNIACMLNDAEKAIDHFKKRLGIELNETTVDKKFSLREVECLGACIAAPVCQIGKKYYENLTPEKIDQIIEELGQ
ncbi:MAG: NAD(P)H-dependent oxidoreductase subunit E [Gammaproteobacteria bacterium]|nr:NAD(P)H-dependent oxidoreductase subunit E [Gammaproteobacteria bacterium]